MPQPSEELTTITQKRYQCRHVHAAGHQCGSPALRDEQFCYHHHTTRRPKPTAGKSRYMDSREPFTLPVIEDLPSALSVASQILSRIASNDLDHERSGRLLSNLKIITSIIDKASRAAAKTAGAPSVPVSSRQVGSAADPQPEPLEEVVNDETHGLIAPITEYVGAPSVPVVSERVGSAPEQVASIPPPPPERDYTPEEQEYFNKTISNRGYEPYSEFPRPASITDEDIQTHVNEQRRCLGRPPFTAIKDADGKLIAIHELGARYTKPIIQLLREARSRHTTSPQPATIPTLNASTAPPHPRSAAQFDSNILKHRHARSASRTVRSTGPVPQPPSKVRPASSREASRTVRST